MMVRWYAKNRRIRESDDDGEVIHKESDNGEVICEVAKVKVRKFYDVLYFEWEFFK